MADTLPTPDGPPTPDPTPPAAAPPTTTAETPAPEKTFTQDDLNRFLADEKRKRDAKYADYETLKTAAAELAALKDAQLSETEKLQKRLTELEAAKTQAETRVRETLIRSAVISEAARLSFNDPEDAYRLIDVAKLTIADDGKVPEAAAEVKALAESRKYLIKSGNPALSSFNPAGGGGGVTETDAQRRARIISGGGGQFFDPAAAAQHGGGLVWPKGEPEK